jgi:DNA-binding NarL/FixJ family response regulator
MTEAGGSVVRVLVVEDYAALAEALTFAFSFEDDIDVVGVAPTVAAALELTATAHPDVVLMDVNLPDGNGIEATSAVLEVHPGVAVIVLTAHADPVFAMRAAQAGASGFVPKDVRIAKILAAVRAVMVGAPAVEPTVLHSLLAQAAEDGRSEGAVADVLPPDDVAVLELLASGIGMADMAEKLGVSEADVAQKVRATAGRLGARSPLEALVRAARVGVLDRALADVRSGRRCARP